MWLHFLLSLIWRDKRIEKEIIFEDQNVIKLLKLSLKNIFGIAQVVECLQYTFLKRLLCDKSFNKILTIMKILTLIFVFLCVTEQFIQSNGNVVYKKRVRKVKPKKSIPNVNEIEVVVEEFETALRPPIFGSGEELIDKFLNYDLKYSSQNTTNVIGAGGIRNYNCVKLVYRRRCYKKLCCVRRHRLRPTKVTIIITDEVQNGNKTEVFPLPPIYVSPKPPSSSVRPVPPIYNPITVPPRIEIPILPPIYEQKTTTERIGVYVPTFKTTTVRPNIDIPTLPSVGIMPPIYKKEFNTAIPIQPIYIQPKFTTESNSLWDSPVLAPEIIVPTTTPKAQTSLFSIFGSRDKVTTTQIPTTTTTPKPTTKTTETTTIPTIGYGGEFESTETEDLNSFDYVEETTLAPEYDYGEDDNNFKDNENELENEYETQTEYYDDNGNDDYEDDNNNDDNEY